MEKLISMTDFVIHMNEKSNMRINSQYYYILEYANLLKQPLAIGMFLPCKFVDGVWVVLEEPPKNVDENNLDWQIEYQEAKERFLFEGFSCIGEKGIYIVRNTPNSWCIQIGFKNKCKYSPYEIVEDLVKHNLELTPTAQKQIGL